MAGCVGGFCKKNTVSWSIIDLTRASPLCATGWDPGYQAHLPAGPGYEPGMVKPVPPGLAECPTACK